jgi:hypothetical protein
MEEGEVFLLDELREQRFRGELRRQEHHLDIYGE